MTHAAHTAKTEDKARQSQGISFKADDDAINVVKDDSSNLTNAWKRMLDKTRAKFKDVLVARLPTVSQPSGWVGHYGGVRLVDSLLR